MENTPPPAVPSTSRRSWRPRRRRSWRKLMEFSTCYSKRSASSSSASDHHHHHHQQHTPPDDINLLEEDVMRLPRRFEYEQLSDATNGFKNIVTFGNVYLGNFTVFKGTLIDRSGVHMEVEVKRIESTRGGDMESEAQFAREVIASASLHHDNIAHFIGYCYDPSRRHRYLVHKFYENRSLDKWFYNNTGSFTGNRLSWDSRYRIAIDIATALRYLHDDCYDKIIHRNVSMSNILLDGDFRAHLTGFGLSRLMDKDERVLNIVKVVDSVPYSSWPREYFKPFLIDSKDGGMNITEKVDVYAYGMLLLDMVDGEINLGGKEQVAESVLELLSRHGDVSKFVDKRLLQQEGGGGFDNIDMEEQVRLVLTVAMWCMQYYPETRPSMARVVAMLQGKSAVDVPPKISLSAPNISKRSTINLKPIPTLERAAIRRLFPPRMPENDGVGT